jgi:prepilin-type N-terminal cleavage/methylation domain-containing protein
MRSRWNASCRVPAPMQRRSSGFTLIELMVVLALITILGFLAVPLLGRQNLDREVSRASAQIRWAMERARGVAMIAGPRIGTDRLVLDAASCLGGITAPPTTNQVWFMVRPGDDRVVFPRDIQNDDTTDQATVFCNTLVLQDTPAQTTHTTFRFPAADLDIAFGATGRVTVDDGGGTPGTTALVMLESNVPGTNQQGFGVRVLPSGVLCTQTVPDEAAIRCDEDPA